MNSNRRTHASKPRQDVTTFAVTEKNIPASASAHKAVASVQHVKAHAAKTLTNPNASVVVFSNAVGVTNGRRKVLVAKLQDKKYRDAYVRATVAHGIAHQVRVNRELRKLSQKSLADRCGGKTTQVAISRLEDPANGNFTLNTILKVASALDVAVLVRLVPYSKFLLETADKSVMGLFAKSFHDENLQATQAMVTFTMEESVQQSVSYISIGHLQGSTGFSVVARHPKQSELGCGYTVLRSSS